MGYRIGVDVGGTFTDLALIDEGSGALTIGKVPSVPTDPAVGILQGIQQLLTENGIAPKEVTYLAHGTTVATNTLLQHKGAKTGLITTRGFRDLLEIARQRRPSLYDLRARKPTVLVPRHLRFEVTERVMADGRIRLPLDMDEVDRALTALAEARVEALVICFLYSYVRPEHERLVLERARARLPGVFCTASHEVAPVFREYERLSTTVVNAYLGPVMAGYIEGFQRRVEEVGIPVRPHINQSNGGTIGIAEAARNPVKTLLSGLSAGVAGAAWLAARAGLREIATFDMGGTSTDVSLARGGDPAVATEREIAGLPIRVAALDIHTIGAGGGSIASRDSGGALQVGPRSAGADPGPACYGRGGMEATVTDANLVLGRLSPRGLLDGRVPLDIDAAQEAVSRLGHELGLSLEETARGVIKVVNANMARALRLVTIQRGVDPNDLALVAFGGAGPLHAPALARELAIPRIVVPPNPGILCAVGLLVEDLRSDDVRTWLGPLEPDALLTLEKHFLDLEARACEWLDRERVGPERRRLSRCLDLRYEGQNYELVVDVPDEVWTEGAVERLRQAFLRAHEDAYGFSASGEPIQIVNLRLTARGTPDLPRLASLPAGGRDAQAAVKGSRAVDFDDAGGRVECHVYERARLRAGNEVVGPAVIEQFDSTTLVEPGQRAVVDGHGFLMMEAA